ncbi:MAG TPA: hypothetical protein VM345_08170 [Acidimicrobiales bacterium]|nr:hypothetical protein [Acidimicrobiales bacterium]
MISRTSQIRPRVVRDDAGAYLVVYALLAVGIFAAVALVLDIAALRHGRRADRAATDLAVTAAASVLDPIDPPSAAPACQAAWDYVVLNRDDAEGAVSPPDCAAIFSAGVCDPTTPVTATGTYGPLTVSITHPVPDGDPLMRSELIGGDRDQPIDPGRDGLPCQRMAVRVERDRTFLFGAFVGTESSRTDVHSVARRIFQTGPDVPAIVALEPAGCDGIRATAAPLSVVPLAANEPDSIVVDTDLSACATGFAIDAAVPGAVTAGRIEAHALAGPSFARTANGVVAPAPTPAPARLGRGFLDVRYNCGAPCGQPAGALDALRAREGGPAAPVGLPVVTPGAVGCTVSPGETLTVTGDVYVDCDELRIEGRVTFTGQRAVVRGNVVITDSGCAAVNDSACGGVIGAGHSAVTVFVRGSVVKEPQATLALTRTFLHTGGFSAVAPAAPGSSQLRVSAPASGPFEDLLLWTDGSGDVRIGEQQVFQVEGTVAAPNAAVVLEGTTAGLGVFNSQIVARRIETAGTEPIVVSPSAGRATGRVARQVKLLR